MDIKAIHDAFTQEKDNTIEGQMHWLKKQGFTEDQMNHAILEVYFDLERGCIPCKWNTGAEVVYLPGDQPKSGEHWEGGPISTANDLDQYLLKVAKVIRTKELTDKAVALGGLISKMKSQWEADMAKANAKPGFFKRLFGKKAEE